MGKCEISQINDGSCKGGKLKRYGFGTGHVMNDMAGSLFNAYALLYFTNVVELGPIYCGIIFTACQITDGLSTVVVGALIDKNAPFMLCQIYGKRKVDTVQ